MPSFPRHRSRRTGRPDRRKRFCICSRTFPRLPQFCERRGEFFAQIRPPPHRMKWEAFSHFLRGGKEITMCLLYSILYGCGYCRPRTCGCGACGSVQSACGCAQNLCGNAHGGCGCAQSGASCCENTYGTQNGAAACCCRCRDCSGFGRHGGLNVCCDAAYYSRQYALCCACNSCANNCNCGGTCASNGNCGNVCGSCQY